MQNGTAQAEPGSVYRSLGRASAWERVGCGVLDKSGRSVDHRDYLAPTYSMVWILAGRGVFQDADGRHHPLAPGDCFQRWPGRRHSTVLDPQQPWREVWIDLGPGLHEALAGAAILVADPPVWHPPRLPLDALLALRRDLEAAGDGALPACFSRALALLVAAREGCTVAVAEDPIEQACRLLGEDSLGRGDLRAWCRDHGLHYDRFRREFEQRVGEPPGRYRIRRRLERACALLHAGERSISEIAALLGYASPYEFSAQFRRRYGRPPSRYRPG